MLQFSNFVLFSVLSTVSKLVKLHCSKVTVFNFKSLKLTKFIHTYKSARSRLIKRDFPRAKKDLVEEMVWPKSFCLITTNGVTNEP